MKLINTSTVTFAVSIAFSAGAIAEGMSKRDYKAGIDKIAAELKVAKAACTAFSGNTRDICVVEAKGKWKIARSEAMSRTQLQV